MVTCHNEQQSVNDDVIITYKITLLYHIYIRLATPFCILSLYKCVLVIFCEDSVLDNIIFVAVLATQIVTLDSLHLASYLYVTVYSIGKAIFLPNIIKLGEHLRHLL